MMEMVLVCEDEHLTSIAPPVQAATQARDDLVAE